MENMADKIKKSLFDIDLINEQLSNTPEDFIEKCEKAYNDNLNFVTSEIAKMRDEIKIVMLAGPSGSGKTTTANLLALGLKDFGVNATVVSLDDFYLTGDLAPLDEDGNRDYETVYALDIPLVRKCLTELLTLGKTKMPKYYFGSAVRLNETREVVLNKDDIIIIEGLHALNPLFTDGINLKGIVKIFINPGGLIMQGEKILLSDIDVRFMRRLVRDYKFRMASAELTLSMWNNVVKAEDKFIYPFIKDSNFYISTIHPYEISAIGMRAKKLLEEVDESDPNYSMACEILNKISFIETMDESLVPYKSMLREFIGNGYFNPDKS